VQCGIHHHVLGGFWVALAQVLHWVRPPESGARPGSDPGTQYRILVILAGSMVAIALSFVAGALLTWLPPNRTPGLAQLFPPYLGSNPNTTSFPSQSVTLYTSIAAGIYALRRRLGAVLFVTIPLLIALPRMYVGGHYLTDILVGFGLGIIGFWTAQQVGERLPPMWRVALGRSDFLPRARQVVVFVWILEVAIEFRDASWLMRVAHTAWQHALHL
jgi:membrane-associated phospholipid phosphatase